MVDKVPVLLDCCQAEREQDSKEKMKTAMEMKKLLAGSLKGKMLRKVESLMGKWDLV